MKDTIICGDALEEFKKETPDGQTHYENDDCGEPAHNPEKFKEVLEENADNIVNHFMNLGASVKKYDYDYVLRHLEKAREETRAAVLNEVEQKVLALPMITSLEKDGDMRYAGYKRTDLLEILKNK